MFCQKITILSLSLLVGLTGCTFLPSSGPSGFRIKNQSGSKSGHTSYQLLEINDQVLDVLKATSPRPACLAVAGRPMDESFKQRGIESLGVPKTQKIAPGDMVHISFIENDSRLFLPSLQSGLGAASPLFALPPQRLDETGEISVPYAGRIKVKDRLPKDIEDEIREKLNSQSTGIQVMVTIPDRMGGNLVTVSGDVRTPCMVPVSPAGTRILDVISAAGGNPGDPFDYMVTVTRAGRNISEPLRTIFDEPSKNILLQAGDTVVLRKRPLNFLALGATGKVSSFPIIVEDLNLVEAIASSGGPNDNQANPATIFIYRQESPEVLSRLGKKNPAGAVSTVPIIYQLNLHDPSGFFLANNFTMRDRDVIYYAPAGSTGLMKFMGLINTFIAPAVSGLGVAGSAATLGAF